jgi:hypothetical protein
VRIYAALIRRAGKYSRLSAVVLQWSRAQKRYERQGLLVEQAALQRAEQECLADEDLRAGHRERETECRAELDQEYVMRFAARVRELFPNCPAGGEQVIAEHACQKYSGRVGRSAGAKRLDEDFIRLAVIAHVRNAETNYDEFLAQGLERRETRRKGWLAGRQHVIVDLIPSFVFFRETPDFQGTGEGHACL